MSLPSANQATVIVTNPSATRAVQVSLTTVAGGQAVPVTGTTSTETIAAGRRGGFVVPTGASVVQNALQVVASAPVVVEERLAFTGAGQSSAAGRSGGPDGHPELVGTLLMARCRWSG